MDQFGIGRHVALGGGRAVAIETRTTATIAGHRAPPALELLEADAPTTTGAARDCAHKGRVIISTVGPYALYGEPLVRACAGSGTDYCDLAGEVQWMRRMIAQYEATAVSVRRTHRACVRLRFDPVRPRRASPAVGCARALRRAVSRGKDARADDARRLFRWHGGFDHECRQGSRRESRAAQGTRRSVFVVPGRLHAARPATRSSKFAGARSGLQQLDRAVRHERGQHAHRASVERVVAAGVWRRVHL